ncbi:hypothetical protein NDU88_001268 [Pleurodeles waltl]|uniref:Receptor ligand binding region domain-containing protein n=1 Tax=Pleurodeles waltl TaxID=8319 RepID=A0AAV7KRL4_PLEWA|nr:hypothetical protein NDU88_001268 [Pleurodeles waltl]
MASSGTNVENYESLQAMVFAIEINKNPNFLPNTSLGFRIYDSCRVMQRSLEGTLWFFAGFVSTSPLLSDRKQFPSFFCTIPNDDYQSRGLGKLLIHFGWTWIGLLVEDNDYGQQGAHVLKEELDKAGVCIAFSENIILSQAYRNAFHIIQVMKSSTANVIVIFFSDAGLGPLVDEMMRQKVTGKVWIATEGWSISAPLAMGMYSGFLVGTIGLASRNGEMPGLEEHLNSVHQSRSTENGFLPIFWEAAFGCQWIGQKHLSAVDNASMWCTGDERLESVQNDYNDVANLRVAYNVYNAVYATAWALHDLNSERAVQLQLLNGTWKDIAGFKPWQLIHYIKKVRFENKGGGEVIFNRNGEVPAQYDIINWQSGPAGRISQVTVGRYDHSAPRGRNLIINVSAVIWPSQGSHICYFSTSPLLSDQRQFPSFFRTIQSDDFQSRGLAQLLLHFGWTWVGLLATDNDYGKLGVQIIRQELLKAGACVAFSESIITNRLDKNAFHIAKVTKASSAMVIIVFSSEASLVPVMDEMVRENVIGKTWIASEAWSTSALLSTERYQKVLIGLIGFATYSGEMLGFKEHLTSMRPSKFSEGLFIKAFGEIIFNCSWLDNNTLLGLSESRNGRGTGDEKLTMLDGIFNELSNPRVTYNVYGAVYAIALALHDLNTCTSTNGSFVCATCVEIRDFQPWQMVNMCPFFRPFPGPHQKILDNACEIFQFIDKTIQEHRQTLDAENPKDYIDAYLLEMDKVRGQDP